MLAFFFYTQSVSVVLTPVLFHFHYADANTVDQLSTDARTVGTLDTPA